jgi:hypothetical protein
VAFHCNLMLGKRWLTDFAVRDAATMSSTTTFPEK